MNPLSGELAKPLKSPHSPGEIEVDEAHMVNRGLFFLWVGLKKKVSASMRHLEGEARSIWGFRGHPL